MSEQFCTFWLNDIYFGISVQHIQEVIRPQVITRVPLAPADICGLINLRGQIVTVIDLPQRLDMGKSQHPQELGFHLVVCFENEIVSLVVDDVGDVLEFSANNLQLPPATLKGKMRQILVGAYPLAQGFLLIIDTEKILNLK